MPTPRDGRKTVCENHRVRHLNVANATLINTYVLYQSRERWRPETARVRRSQLHKVADQLATTPLIDATEDDLVHWHDHVLTGAPETRAAYVSAVHGIYQWMSVYARPRYRTDDPTLILKRPRIPTASPRPLLNRHYDLALACAVADPEMYLWLGLMGCCGLRCCEIAWLQIGDVEPLDDRAGLLHVTGKGGKRRIVPVGRMLMLTLNPFLMGRGPVFVRQSDGKAYTPDGVSARVAKFLRGLGINGTAHQLRHRFGTDFHQLDPDLYRQAKIMGHASVDTTQRYTEVSPLEAARHIETLTRRRLVERQHGAARRAG
jgi:site-specific recombinase XerD